MTRARSKQIDFRLEAFGLSDVGRVRDVNEDAFAVLPEQGLFLVADGVGGADAGEVASQIVVEVVPTKLAERLAALRRNASRAKIESAIRKTLQKVNDRMVAAISRRADLEEMGTTVVLALLWNRRVVIAHLGDSRAYLWRDRTLRQLTADHSLAAQLVRWGKITESQAEDNPGRSTLLRCLGKDEEVEPDFVWLAPRAEDQLLLCTDGLTNMVTDEEIAKAIESSDTVESCCKTLVSQANAAGGRDNVTVLTIQFHATSGNSTCGGTSAEDMS